MNIRVEKLTIVDADYRSQEVGAALVRAAQQIAKEKGWKRIDV